MTLGELGEFGFIDKLRTWAPDAQIDDDAALVQIGGSTFAMTTDALVEGVHFRTDWSSPEDIGWKAVTVSVSDLAASGGGSSSWLLLAVGAPRETSSGFLEGIYRGAGQACASYRAHLVGGDTVSAHEVFLSVTAIGPVFGQGLRRSGARVGDVLAVTGPLGRAAAGANLLLSQDPKKVVPEDAMACIEAHRRPVARIESAERFAPVAHGAIDLSDGLASDARRIAEASGYGVAIDALPIAPEVERIAAARGWDAEVMALSGGEDFELVFSLPDEHVGDLIPIGRVVDHGVVYKGEPMPMSGYDHFPESGNL